MDRFDTEGKNMLLTVYSVLDSTTNNYTTLRPGLVGPKNQLKDQILLIITAETKAASPIFGAATDKENKFNLMMTSLSHVASAATAYYSVPATADPELRAKVNFTLPQLLNMTYTKVQADTQAIINVITPIIDDLEPFGAEQTNLDDAINKRKDFIEVQTKPRTNIDERKVQNANIHPFVKEGKRICDEIIDPIIRTLFNNHHDLYELYVNARQIINLPHGSTVVQGYVYKSDGVTPLYGATVKFAEQNLMAITLLDGSYRLIKFPIGTSTPTVIYNGTEKTFPPFEVKLGKTVKQNFLLDS